MSPARGRFSPWSPDGRWLLAMNEMRTHYLVDTVDLVGTG
jgi:hypothetical protein